MIQHSKKLVGLDILRALACLAVWVSHVRVVTDYFKDDKYNFLQTFMAWGREAVVIFFILSGIVINLASKNRTDRGQYFKKRFLRIYPIFFTMLVICYSADYFIFHHALNIHDIVGNIFLQGMWPAYIVPTIPFDLAAWSIACEAFFYVVFGLFYNSNRLKVVWIWFGLSIVSIIFHLVHEYGTGVLYQFAILMNNSFLWLLGYLVYEYRDRLYATAQTAACGLLMIPLITRLNSLPGSYRQACYYIAGLYLVPLFVFVLKKYSTPASAENQIKIKHIYILPVYLINLWLLSQYSNSLLVSKLLYAGVPFISLALYIGFVKNMLKWICSKLKQLLLFFADISYPLYLVHMPTMVLVYHYLPGQKLIGMMLIIVIAITVSYLFEVYLFRKLTAIVNHTSASKQPVEETII